MTDETLSAVINVFGTKEERKRLAEYEYRRDHFNEIVAAKTEDLVAKVRAKLQKGE